MPSPERPAGCAEPFPICDPRSGDCVARGGRQTRAALLAAADGRGPAGPGDGRHTQVHPECRVEMVEFDGTLHHSDLF